MFERVDLELEVVAGVARRVEEDLEVVVVEDHRIVLGERGPDVRLLQLGGDVEVVVVPEHFGAGAEAGRGAAPPRMSTKAVGPGGGLPRGVVELAVDADRRGRADAGVMLHLRGGCDIAPNGKDDASE